MPQNCYKTYDITKNTARIEKEFFTLGLYRYVSTQNGMDSEFSWTLFFKMGEFQWPLSEGEFSWTLLVNSQGFPFLSEFPWTYFG